MNERETIVSAGFRKLGICLALVAALVCTATGVWDRAYDWAVGDAMRRHNTEHLETAAKKAAALLVPVGAARGAVDVVEGSEMVVEFGDLVQPILDYLDITWQVVLTASIAMVATQQLLDGTAGLGSIFLSGALAVFLLLVLVQFFVREPHALAQILRRLAGMCLLVALVFHIVLPVSICASSWLSRNSTATITAEYEKTFDQLAKTFSMRDVSASETLRDKADGFKEKAEQLVHYVEAGGARDLGKSVVYVTVAYTLDGIVFPLLTLLFLVWFIRGSLYPVLGLVEQKA